ncbi:unnamed protein product [Prunus armeniaca]
MTPTVLDLAALFSLSSLGMEVNAALVAPEAEGSFKAAWPTVAKLAGSKVKNMLNYSSFYGNFGVEDIADDDSIAPLGEVEHAAFLLYWLCKFVFCTQANKVTLEFAHLADYLAQGGRLALGPFLLGHIYRTLHDVVTDGMKPKHGGPRWAFQFWLQAYFPELRGAVSVADTEPLATAFARAPKKHNASTFCYKFFYELTERTGSQFRVSLARPYPLYLAHDLSIIPDGETENDLREIWGSFLVKCDLHCGLSKAGAEVYLPHFVARQFGLIQMAPLPPLSINRLSSWRADVAQQHCMAGISFHLQKGMSFITLRPWMRRNAVDEDGRLWYKDCISTRFIRPAEEAVMGALKNADWDPSFPRLAKGRKPRPCLLDQVRRPRLYPGWRPLPWLEQ